MLPRRRFEKVRLAGVVLRMRGSFVDVLPLGERAMTRTLPLLRDISNGLETSFLFRVVTRDIMLEMLVSRRTVSDTGLCDNAG